MRLLQENISRLGCILLMIMSVPALMQADDVADLTKTIMQDKQDAVVLTKTVLEMYESETKSEGLATIINQEGLAVISLSSISASFYRPGMEEVKVKDIKMVLSDNTEIPSRVVLRDPELDLAFIKPLEKPDRDLVFISLSEYATPEILDQIAVLSRLGAILGNVPAMSIARVQAIIEKPRLMFMPEPFAVLASGMGTPVFSLDGKIIGILLLKVALGSEGYPGDAAGFSNLLPIVLPAQEIIDVMEKAPELKE